MGHVARRDWLCTGVMLLRIANARFDFTASRVFFCNPPIRCKPYEFKSSVFQCVAFHLDLLRVSLLFISDFEICRAVPASWHVF